MDRSTRMQHVPAVMLVVAAVAAFGATRSFGQTTLEACFERALVEANDCYMAAGDSWFKGKACDLKLEFRLVQCVLA